MTNGTLPATTTPKNGGIGPMPDERVTVRVVFHIGNPEAPLPNDPNALFVTLDEPVTPGSQEEHNALGIPIRLYLSEYSPGCVSFNFSSGGYITRRHLPMLHFYYEQVPANSPAEWAVLDTASAIDYDGPAAHDHSLWFGSTDYRKAIENAPRVRSRRTPVLINGVERGLVEVMADGTINALWHVRDIYGEIHDLVLQRADCGDLDAAVAVIVRCYDRPMERDLACRAHAQSDR